MQHIRDLPHRDGLRAHITQPFIDGQLLLLADAQRFIELPARLQHIRDLPHRDGLAPGIPQPAMEGDLHLAPVGEGFIEIPQIEQQPAQLIDRRNAQLIGRFWVLRQPGPDLGHPPAALGHRAAVHSPMAAWRERCYRHLHTLEGLGSWGGCGQKRIHTAPPGPKVGCAAGGQGDCLPIQPEHQAGPGFGRQTLPAHIERIPAGGVKPAGAADHVHHSRLARIVHQPGFQHRHIRNLVA